MSVAARISGKQGHNSTPPESQEEETKLWTIISIAILTAGVAVLLASCGESGVDETTVSGHELSAEETGKLIADFTEDLQIIAGITPETVDDLSRALTGSALADTKAGINNDLAQGRFRRRDYRNINVRPEEYNAPIAEMFAEFDDFGYYVDAKTQAQLAQPTGEHKTFAFSVVEEDGRWKIRGIFETSNPNTPRELPPTFTEPPATTPTAATAATTP